MADGDQRYSHPPENGDEGVLLIDHLTDVRDRVDMVVPDSASTPSDEPLVDIVRKLGLIHDFGKATTFFQQYIGIKPGQPSPEKKRHHSPLGAFAAYFVLRESGYDPETCLAGFVAVAKHHGRLPDVAEYVAHRTSEDEDPERLAVLVKQLVDIKENAPELAANVFEMATGQPDAWTTFLASFDGYELPNEITTHVVREWSTPPSVQTDPLSNEFYGLVLECWGTLVLADKTSAAGATNDRSVYDPVKPAFDVLDGYVREEIESDADADQHGDRAQRLEYFRSKARSDVLENVPEFVASDSNVATITLPTGMGKTLTGVSAALSIRDATESDRVVYALPFTSIIDQVVDEVESIFDSDGTDGLVATHHHLADTRIDQLVGDSIDTDDHAYDEADRSDDVAGMLGESWRAGLTVTTFVQLFESLAGPRNTQSMKLPAVRDSVIILDEPQSLPLSWWKLVPRLVDVLTDQYDATIVSMTATQPKLFDDAMELVDDVNQYFDVAERVQYRLHPSVEELIDGSNRSEPDDAASEESEPLDYESAADEIAEDARDGIATLAICNTIDSTRRLTETVTERLEVIDVAETYLDAVDGDSAQPVDHTVEALTGADGIPFVHLSSRLRPTDRLALVTVVKRLRDRGVQVVAVTTQLVEAGVDVSFEAVYRDLAPVDSIVQAAGRCNRSFEQERGTVTIWWLAEPADQTKTPAVAVYDNDVNLTPVTVAALERVRRSHGDLSGRNVSRETVEAYYEILKDEKDVGRQSYADLVDSADGEGLGRLSLINSPRAVDVIVCLTEDDEELVEDLESAYNDYDFDRVKELIDETKHLRVSVPIYRADSQEADVVTKLPPLAGRKDESDVRVLRPADPQYKKYFDERTGFLVPDLTVEDRFL